MAWIESHQSLREHHKTKKLARLLKISRPCAIGHLHCLWWWALDFAESGNLSGIDVYEIADAAGWDSDPDEFVRAMVDAGFLEFNDSSGIYSIHDWRQYAGKYAETRAIDAERKRSARKQTSNGRPVVTSRTSNNLPLDVRMTSGGSPEDVGRSPTVTSTYTSTSTKPSTKEQEELRSPEIAVTRENATQTREEIPPTAGDLDSELRDAETIYVSQGFGALDSGVSRRLKAMIQAFGSDKLMAAITEALVYGVTDLNYVAKVLKTWKQGDFRSRDAPAKNARSPDNQRDERYLAFYELFPNT